MFIYTNDWKNVFNIYLYKGFISCLLYRLIGIYDVNKYYWCIAKMNKTAWNVRFNFDYFIFLYYNM